MPEVTISQALSNFLKSVPINHAPDLTSRCTADMEIQMMMDASAGEPVYDGNRLIRNTWEVCSDDYGTYRFYHIRIPRNSMSEPFFNDRPVGFPLERHLECVGMTGWNWKRKRSLWVGFDFDAITGHAAGVGVSDTELKRVQKAASQIPWVQVRRSTGGAGLHLYVYFDPENAPETENHNVHSALARAVLGLMEREAGFDFRGNMDVLGGNMWIWHRKVSDDNEGLSIIKDYEQFCEDLPENWRDNLDVIKGVSGRVRFRGIDEKDYDNFEAVSYSRVKVTIDDKHREIEERIHKLGYSIVWVPDHHCWQTHTHAFQTLMEEYPDEYVGVFKTLSDGKDPSKPNCFAFPLPDGGMRVTRFGKGARESDGWHQGDDSWTWTYFNVKPSLEEASTVFGGAKDPSTGAWVFSNFEDAEKVCNMLGDSIVLPDDVKHRFENDRRNIYLKLNKDKKLFVEIDRKKDDDTPKGWIAKKGKFTCLLHYANPDSSRPVTEEVNYDDLVRCVVDVNNEFSQWVLRDNEGEWIGHGKDNIRSALKIKAGDKAEEIIGHSVIKSWKIVNVPFQPEYLGDRRWNRFAPQFAVPPGESGAEHPHWDMIMDHCGQDLDEPLKQNTWCKEAGIHTGADYLRYWVAFMLRDPYCKLPYLFFHGPQNSGKSMFHEAISAFLVTSGVVFADEALKNKNGFNGEVAGSILCVVEETNLSEYRSLAYDRMKAWITGEEIPVHKKYLQPYKLKNSTHWVQTANDRSYCPVFPGDTRVVMLRVPMIPEGREVPKEVLKKHLKEEASDFLRTLLDLKLPSPPGRLRLPVMETDSKKGAEEENNNALSAFFTDKCYPVKGALIRVKDLYEAFMEYCGDDSIRYNWPYAKVIRELKDKEFYPVGKAENNVLCLGNVSLEPQQKGVDYGPPYVFFKGKLVRSDG